jgi:hypothetical protein
VGGGMTLKRRQKKMRELLPIYFVCGTGNPENIQSKKCVERI